MAELEKTFRKLQPYWLGDSSEPFSDKVLELAYEPLHVGELEKPDSVGTVRDECGDVFELFLKIENGEITGASFLSDGCGVILACGSALCELVIGKTIVDAGRLESADVAGYLGGLPDSHQHCADQAIQVLQNALREL